MDDELHTYLVQVLDGFDNDPADTDFQRGYLSAIIAVTREFCPDVIITNDLEHQTIYKPDAELQ